MAAPNPKAITWIFSYQLVDHRDPSKELAHIESVSLLSWVQYIPLHLCKPRDNPEAIYIRGILRCHSPRSRKQLLAVMPQATFIALRGRFDSSVVHSKLKASYRVGNLIEYGSFESTYTPPLVTEAVATKRSFSCVEYCNCPCNLNKRPSL